MPSINLGKVVGTVDANTPITFEDYTSTTAPEPEEALSKITSPNTISNLFKYIKGFLNNAIHKNNITNSIDTNDSTKVPSSTVTYSLKEKITSTTGDLGSLQTTDKTNLVNALNEVFTLGNENKQKLVTNLIAKGVTCSIDDSWENLLAKVLDIVAGIDISDTTAIASHVLETDYFYTASGVKTQGTMVDRSCVNGNEFDILNPSYPRQTIHEYTVSAPQYGTWGNNEDKEGLIVPAPSGYFNNVYGSDLSYVYVPASTLRGELGITADKILAGNTICGVDGTASVGKKFASGTIDVPELSSLPTKQFGGYIIQDKSTTPALTFYYITISLDFIPSLVVADLIGSDGEYVINKTVCYKKDGSNYNVNLQYKHYQTNVNMANTMEIPVLPYDGFVSTTKCKWIAYE